MEFFTQILQVVWWLGWLLALFGWIGFVVCLGWLQGSEQKTFDAHSDLTVKQHDNALLSQENDALCGENEALCGENEALCGYNNSLIERNEMLTERIAQLEPKADELDKMHERAAIVKAAYEQHTKKGQCPVQHHQVFGKGQVHTGSAYLN